MGARVVAHRLGPGSDVPNHPHWPLLVYPRAVAIRGDDPARAFEALFTRNRWPAAWRDGIDRDVPLPDMDPVFGPSGPLFEHWR